MQNTVFFGLLLTLSLNILSCASGATSGQLENINVGSSVSQSKLKEPCANWSRMYELLSNTGKKQVDDEGISLNGDDKVEESGYYVISDKIIPDCQLRVDIGRFLYATISGNLKPTDDEFANKNSEEIVRVLRHVWNSPGFSSDGTSHEKYLLLTNKSLQDEHISSFVDSLLKERGVNSDLLYVIVARPLKVSESVVKEAYAKSVKDSDIQGQIASLVALSVLSPTRENLGRLRQFTQNKKIDDETKAGILAVTNKLASGKTISADDLDSLGLDDR